MSLFISYRYGMVSDFTVYKDFGSIILDDEKLPVSEDEILRISNKINMIESKISQCVFRCTIIFFQELKEPK